MTLAEALEPLYRAYLRRLEEMVARLPAGEALTERTTRGSDGRLALAPDGLPLRFDVADARDGHTYEVHGAKADEPLVREIRVAGLLVRLGPGNWEDLPVVCAFEGTPPGDDVEALGDVMRAFTVLAWHGGFAAARPESAARWTGRAHGGRIELRGKEVWAVLDLGTCPPSALEALCAAFGEYALERAPLLDVRIGGEAQAG
jgi:hypothetical protein